MKLTETFKIGLDIGGGMGRLLRVVGRVHYFDDCLIHSQPERSFNKFVSRRGLAPIVLAVMSRDSFLANTLDVRDLLWLDHFLCVAEQLDKYCSSDWMFMCYYHYPVAGLSCFPPHCCWLLQFKVESRYPICKLTTSYELVQKHKGDFNAAKPGLPEFHKAEIG